MDVKNIRAELQKAPVDGAANIKVVRVTGDEEISVFAAEISPRTELNPHYHGKGIETYQIFEGAGVMKVGQVANGKVQWQDVLEVKTGDCFSIAEGKVHQIINETDEPLIALFTCPAAHLSTDRFFVDQG